MGRLIYFVREALHGLYQAKLMTFLSMVTIAISLFILSLAVIGAVNIQRWFGRAFRQVDIVVYVDEALAADSAACAELGDRLREFPQVKSLSLVDKTEAWDRFQRWYGEEMLDAVEENPLPASFEVVLAPQYRVPEEASKLRREFAQIKGTDGVRFSRERLAVLQRFRRYFLVGAAVLALVCMMVLRFIVSSTIKLTIYARRGLISNMRFVGASDLYIEMPFILEGILQGVVGAGLAVMGVWTVKLFLGDLHLWWGAPFLLPAVLAVGVVFGWLGSASAVRRFLV